MLKPLLKLNIFVLLPIALLWSLGILAQQIPDKHANQTHHDQNLNLSNMPMLSESEKQIIPIFHVEIPLSEAKVFSSQFLDQETKDFAITPEGKLRVFFLNNTLPAYVTLSKKYGVLPQEFWGTKMLSHSTYLVWDNGNVKSMYIKFETEEGTTNESTIRNAIALNDYVEIALADNPDDIFVSVMPERFGASVLEGEYSFSLRNTKPIRGPPLKPNLELEPLHAVLSPLLLKSIASKKKMDKQEWILQEYLPKLASFIAKTNFIYGVYPEAHTQNLLVYIDKSTGEILGFVFRDLNDTAIDPFIRLAQNKDSINEPVKNMTSVSRLGIFHMGDIGKKGNPPLDAGWINSTYVGFWNLQKTQGTNGIRDPLLNTFFKYYIPEVEKYTGVKIEMENLPGFYTQTMSSNRGYRVFQAIYEQVVDHYMKELKDNSTNYNQAQLAKIFKRHFEETKEVSLLRSNSRKLLELYLSGHLLPDSMSFTFSKGKIVMLDKSSTPIAVAFALTVNETRIIEGPFVRSFIRRCISPIQEASQP